MEKPIVCEGCKVPKGWGEELIIENNDKYCGKLLIFKAGCKFSMHYHMIKDETWYVDKGEFLYRWIDTETAETHEEHLKPGDLIVINDRSAELIRGSEKRTILSYGNDYAIPFIIDCDKTISDRVDGSKLLELNYIKDVTKQFMRDQKLNELGI